MPINLVDTLGPDARSIQTVEKGRLEGLPERERSWAEAVGFSGDAGAVLIVPGQEGTPASAVLGLGTERRRDRGAQKRRALLAGALSDKLPAGDWRLEGGEIDAGLAALAVQLGDYRFARYKTNGGRDQRTVRLGFSDPVDIEAAERAAQSVSLVRDLVNTPTSDMGPAELERAIRTLGTEFGAEVRSVEGEALLLENFPMIHAVGRASAEAPRLVDLKWGREGAPRVTLVGKGVCFDTGGLDIKPSSGMLLMKKDMGGAANVLGLARLIMAARLPVRLRVLVPAVENSISANAFRPGDVLTSRAGRTVEIGNTDAEGRLVLADALTLGDEDEPDLMIDMATLTGAARVALGADLPAFFTHDDAFAASVAEAGERLADPVWRLPLWEPYRSGLASKVADTGNVTTDGFAGAITAALFLEEFVKKARCWAHLDLYAWRAKAAAHGPIGGEAYAIRALFDVVQSRYGA